VHTTTWPVLGGSSARSRKRAILCGCPNSAHCKSFTTSSTLATHASWRCRCPRCENRLLADEDGELSRRLGLVAAGAPKHAADAGRLPFSCTLVLDLDLTVRMLTYYPMGVGRNFYEVLRALDALQLSTFEQVVTPVNWKVSDDVFVEPDVTADAAKKLFPQGTHEIKPYVRLTASPSMGNDK
jgi:hypothetical protein